LGGQKLVAVTTTEAPATHEEDDDPRRPPAHRSSKHAPQLSPPLKSAVLSAVVSVP
jgi:hypothetical protein